MSNVCTITDTPAPVQPTSAPQEPSGGVEGTWAHYWASGSLASRNALVLHYSPLVKYVAGRVNANLPAHVDHGDLVTYGMFGLLDAINKYADSHNTRFETYAATRIRGAIYDELRAIDWVPRTLRRQLRDLHTNYDQLYATNGYPPTDAELATAMDTTVRHVRDLLTQDTTTVLYTLDQPRASGTPQLHTLGDLIATSTTPGPADVAENSATMAALQTGIIGLVERERTIIVLYYWERLTLDDIADVLGISASRVTQLRHRALLQLRHILATTN